MAGRPSGSRPSYCLLLDAAGFPVGSAVCSIYVGGVRNAATMSNSMDEGAPADSGASQLIEDARDHVTVAASVPVSGLEDAELKRLLVGLTALEAQAAALRLELLSEAKRREVAAREGLADTAAWAARLTGTTRAVMAGGMWFVQKLQDRYETTRRSFATGRINEKQMKVIVRAAEKMPAKVTDEQRAEAEAGLVAKAEAGMAADRLRHAARRMLEIIDKEMADASEADQLEEEERRAELETWFTMGDNGDGTYSGRFTIPELHAHLLRSRLELLSTPRRWTRNKAGEPVVDDTLPGMGPELSFTERLGVAFCEMLEHLPTDGHTNIAATLLVTMELEHLQDGLGAAHLDTGVAASPGTARRLSCNAGIIPAVLGGRSEPLDVGREQRLATPAMRKALALIYNTCAAEGCDRPYAWCEIHHPEPWAQGGETSLKNSIPLCFWHHRRAHDSQYRVKYLDTGEVRFRHIWAPAAKSDPSRAAA